MIDDGVLGQEDDNIAVTWVFDQEAMLVDQLCSQKVGILKNSRHCADSSTWRKLLKIGGLVDCGAWFLLCLSDTHKKKRRKPAAESLSVCACVCMCV